MRWQACRASPCPFRWQPWWPPQCRDLASSRSLTPHLLLAGLGLALLLPVVPFSLEMYALRRLTTAAFGTLMCLEPALALIAGFALLGQVPRAWSLTGIAFVVAAGLGAVRTGARPEPGAPETSGRQNPGAEGALEQAQLAVGGRARSPRPGTSQAGKPRIDRDQERRPAGRLR